MKCFSPHALLLPFLLVVPFIPLPLFAARPGVVAFSDGATLEGDISLTPGTAFTLHDGKVPHVLPLKAVREIRFFPEKEEMARAWRFKEAGQAIKEEWGEPYPIRHLGATLLPLDGPGWTGHLFTLPLYVTATGKTHKIVLMAKQKGQPAETLESLAYPVSIRFEDPANAANKPARLTLTPEPGADTELCAITRGALVRLPGRRPSGAGPFLIPAPLDATLFVALRAGDTLRAAWGHDAAPEITNVIRQAVADARDFFDKRLLLGVSHTAGETEVYALVDLMREGTTTLGAEKSQPWRLEVWRFRLDPDTNKVLLAGRAWFFRGITPIGQPRTPATVVDEGLSWTVGEE